MEDPPATPAPLFAVRAFKTAIFGTPHPDYSHAKRQAPPGEQERDVPNVQPAEKVEEVQVQHAEINSLIRPVATSKVDTLASPTKGILLTPGTGATRRKTVSFGTFLADAQKKEEKSVSTEPNLDSALKSRKPPQAVPRIQPRHPSLTRTLVELSKRQSNNQASSITSSEEKVVGEIAPSTGTQTENTDQINDNTVDLCQPRSRSGNYWKTEYEQYHKRSNREMKKIIMYSQNVKSYAVKKDCEATGLGEKLKKELSKVAALEKKVSELAAQLNDACAQGPEGESEQTRLVSKLAQQTALAIRFKQKADHYRRAMQKGTHADGSHGEPDVIHPTNESYHESDKALDAPQLVAGSPRKNTLHSEVESLRLSAKKAENEAAKLEAENDALKRSLARVKGEMMSYEARRQAREERLKRREAKCKADQKACEDQLAKLTVEHQKLLLASSKPTVEVLAEPQPKGCYDDLRRLEGNPKFSERPPPKADKRNPKPVGQNYMSRPPISPRKSKSHKLTVDIWTLSSPRDAERDNISTSKEPTELPPSSVRHDIQRTLKEIDQNLIPEPPQPGSESSSTRYLSQENNPPKSATQTMPQPQADISSPVHHTRKQKPPNTNSLPPATVDLTSSSAKTEPTEAVVKPVVHKAMATVGRSSSLMSAVGSRTSTMTSGRRSVLSAERAAAAKARLAARSAEKRKGMGRRG